LLGFKIAQRFFFFSSSSSSDKEVFCCIGILTMYYAKLAKTIFREPAVAAAAAALAVALRQRQQRRRQRHWFTIKRFMLLPFKRLRKLA